MGSSARIDRCSRFIDAFSSDAERSIKLKSPVEVIYQRLVFVEGEEVVRFGIILRDADGNEVDFVSECVWFDPEEQQGDTVDRVATLTNSTEYDAAVRLKDANLISGDPEDYDEEGGCTTGPRGDLRST